MTRVCGSVLIAVNLKRGIRLYLIHAKRRSKRMNNYESISGDELDELLSTHVVAAVELYHRQVERSSGCQEEINFTPCPHNRLFIAKDGVLKCVRCEKPRPEVMFSYTPINSLLPPK